MPFSALSKRHQGGWHNAVSSIKACVSHKGTTRDGDKYRLNNWGTILSQQEPTWLEAIVKDSCSLFRAGWIWLFVHGENEKKASLSVSVFQSLYLCICLSVCLSLFLSLSSLLPLSLSLSRGGGGGGGRKENKKEKSTMAVLRQDCLALSFIQTSRNPVLSKPVVIQFYPNQS